MTLNWNWSQLLYFCTILLLLLRKTLILIFWNGNFFLLQDRGEEEEKKLTNILIFNENFMSKRKTMDAKLLYHYTTCNLKTLKHKFNILNHFDYFLIEFSLKTNFFVKYLGFFLHSLVWYWIGTSPAVRDLVRLVRMIWHPG